MKKLKEVEANRKLYNNDHTINSVHRASLMVPEIPGTEVDISFLNHFFLKRNYRKIACKITAIDISGNKIQSKLYSIEKPIVYKITLTGMVNQTVSNYMVEFFSPENLFIPFPAVMINHRGNGFINQVHSFNRVLNDVFEDDSINSHQVKEASVDLPLTPNSDTFLLFTAGPLPCSDSFEIEISTKGNFYKKEYPINLPRFGTKIISIKKNFHDLPQGEGGIIKAKQPRQLLFYGRMLTGQSNTDGSFSANHSYYDSSTTEEYWDDNRNSGRSYPFFPELRNIARLYPIMSPSDLKIFIGLFNNNGNLINEIDIDSLHSPSNNFLDIDINSVIQNENLNSNEISTFSVIAKTNSGKMPTRIGHQLVYGAGGLDSSIAVSLFNPNIFNPSNKKSFKWGQIISGADFDSYVGIIADPNENPNIKTHEAKVKFYNSNGLFLEKEWKIKNGTAKKFSANEELHPNSQSEKLPTYFWCTVEAEQYGLNFFSTAYNKITKHTSGDHGF